MNDKTKQPMQNFKSPRHLSYLLRLWGTDGPESFNWHASLENPATGKRVCFAEIELLFAYLMDLIEGNLNEQQDTEKKQIDESGTGITSCER